LTSSTATAGTTSSVTLNTTVSTGNYVNDEIFFPLLDERAFITAYNTANGVATLAPTLATAPSSGTFYSISQTVQVTGYNTTFTSSFNIGDAILPNSYTVSGFVGFMIGNNSGIEQAPTYVAYVASNTLMYGLNGNATNQVASTTVPQVVWRFKQWQAGDCGWKWVANHDNQNQTGNPYTWPTLGGGGADWSSNANGAFIARQTMATGFFLSQFDQRAVMDLAVTEGWWFDFFYATMLAYDAGSTHMGPDYITVTQEGMRLPIQTLVNGLTAASPTTPNLGLTGPAMQAGDVFRMYSILPDWGSTINGTPCMTPVQFGSSPGLFCPTSVGAVDWGTAGAFQFQPNSQQAQLYRNFLENANPSNFWNWGARPLQPYTTDSLLINNPNIGSVDFTTQPRQYLFSSTDWQLAESLAGWNYGPKWAGLLAISRTTWTSINTPSSAKQGAHLMVQFRAYAGDYDCNMFGHVQLWQVGPLLGSDIFTTDSDNCGFGDNSDYTIVGDELQFGGSRSNILDQPPGPGRTVPPATSLMAIAAWSSANHGSWPAPYGDRNSQFMRVCGDESGGYSSAVSFNYDLHCVDDMKPTGGDHFIVDARFVATATNQQIATHIHYPQNGQAQAYSAIAYPEGHTTCPGAHGCTGLNLDRWIQELESGASDGYAADPIPNFGLISRFLSPSNIFVSWDCPGGVECNPGSTYTGGAGNTDRITICAGTGSCSSSANLFESFTVHKIAGSLTDTSLTTSAISTTDGNWFGAQMYGANSCAVVMETRGGVTHATMSSFTPSSSSGVCANNVQYLFGGLTPGSYNVTVGGNTVSGSPFTVSAGDSSIEFTSVGGTVSLYGGGGSSSSSISGQITIGGNVIVH
jgi:hypothetical protein